MVLAGWTGWGAIPEVFDERRDRGWAAELRAILKEDLDDTAYKAARRSTLNAHYTSPEVAAEIWATVQDLGFDGGPVIEPGAGIGVFAATAPVQALLTAVEKDPTTAHILTLLHPDIEVLNTAMEDLTVQPGRFAAAVGNVPFADVVPHDPGFDSNQLALHNYCIAKSLAMVQAGGVLGVITSAYTLDAQSNNARDQIAKRGQFLGAIRLPAETFADNAGTSVTTDIVFYRSFGHQLEEPSPHPGVTVRPDGEGAHSEWFAEHPELIIGEYSTKDMLFPGSVNVISGLTPAEIVNQLAEKRQRLVELSADIAPTDMEPPVAATPPAATAPLLTLEPAGAFTVGLESIPPWAKEGSLFVIDNVTHQRHGNTLVARDKRPSPEMRSILEVRDALMELLAAETSRPADPCTSERQALRTSYDRYTSKHGPISRHSITAAGHRRYPQMGEFRSNDPDYPSLLALESTDDERQIRLAEIFDRRVVRSPPAERTGLDAPQALAVSLARTGGVDLDIMTAAMGRNPEAQDLEDLVLADPEQDGQLVPAVTYLAGNVGAKLAQATTAAALDPTYRANVDALQAAMPEPAGVDDIGVSLGVPWVPASDYKEWFSTIMGGKGFLNMSHHRSTGWMIERISAGYGARQLSEEKWGTAALPADKLVERLILGRSLAVWTTDADDRRVLDMAATLEANSVAEDLQQSFSDWLLHEDYERSARTIDVYNQTFRSHAPLSTNGTWIDPPGLAAGITLRPNQAEAVERILLDGRLLLAHQVGAGKTGVMVTSAIEGKRIGLFSKPAVVVPNHLLEQFTAEAQQWFPNANVLMPTKTDLELTRLRGHIILELWL